MTAPLTLDEVRKAPERELLCWDDVNDLVATIEWLVERIGQALCDEVLTEECKDDCRLCLEAMDDLSEWLRGGACPSD